jgi:protease I
VPDLRGKRIAFIMANEGVEQVELTEPWKALREVNAQCEIVAPQGGDVQAMNHLDKADRFPVDRMTSELRVEDYDGVVLPGGVANADFLRMDAPAVDFIRRFFQAGKPMAVICHAPWALVEADVVRGLTLTSWPSLQTDIRNAGGTWVDVEVHVEHRIVTSRGPDDLKAFCPAMINEFGTP